MTNKQKISYLNKYFCKIKPDIAQKYKNKIPENILLNCINEEKEVDIEYECEYKKYFWLSLIYKFGDKYFNFIKIRSKTDKTKNAEDYGFHFTIDHVIEVEPVDMKFLRYKQKIS